MMFSLRSLVFWKKKTSLTFITVSKNPDWTMHGPKYGRFMIRQVDRAERHETIEVKSLISLLIMTILQDFKH